MSDTPRTDAEVFQADDGRGMCAAVPAEVSQEIERELSAVTAERDALRAEWVRLRRALNQIAHPNSYGTAGANPQQIARAAVLIR